LHNVLLMLLQTMF